MPGLVTVIVRKIGVEGSDNCELVTVIKCVSVFIMNIITLLYAVGVMF